MRIQETVPLVQPVTAQEYADRLSLITDIANERLVRPGELALGGFHVVRDILPDVWHRTTPTAAAQRQELVLERNRALLDTPLPLRPLPRKVLSYAEMKDWDRIFRTDKSPIMADPTMDAAFARFIQAWQQVDKAAKAKAGRQSRPARPQVRVFTRALPQAA